MRVPLDPPYTKDDLSQLDALHDALGLGKVWMKSDKRYEIFVGIHHTHDIVDCDRERVCVDCWGCMCHSVDILKQPCTGHHDLTRKKEA